MLHQSTVDGLKEKSFIKTCQKITLAGYLVSREVTLLKHNAKDGYHTLVF